MWQFSEDCFQKEIRCDYSVVLEDKIREYENICPMNLDLYRMKAELQLLRGNREAAYDTIKEGIRKNPYNMGLNVTARSVCKESG